MRRTSVSIPRSANFDGRLVRSLADAEDAAAPETRREGLSNVALELRCTVAWDEGETRCADELKRDSRNRYGRGQGGNAVLGAYDDAPANGWIGAIARYTTREYEVGVVGRVQRDRERALGGSHITARTNVVCRTGVL